MSGLPMMPWYPRDFIAATRAMRLAERGAYRELLDYQWELGSLPNDHDKLARLLGVTRQEFDDLWPAIADKFQQHSSALFNERLEMHRKKALTQREKRARGAQVTNAKRYGERINKESLSDTHSDTVSDALGDTPTASPPSPSPSPSKRKKNKQKKVEAGTFPPDLSLTSQMRDQALSRYPDCDADEMFAQFRAHHEAHGSSMVSWPAAWRTWVGRAEKFGYPRKSGAQIEEQPNAPPVLPDGKPNPVVDIKGRRVRQFIVRPDGVVERNLATVVWQ